jgi:branched-subunit amino acid aminotransferase/4-amino-4-deoxychorismate lyase
MVQNGPREQVITPRDLEEADAVYLTNAVRGNVRMQWIR